jgi:hypothetical protein
MSMMIWLQVSTTRPQSMSSQYTFLMGRSRVQFIASRQVRFRSKILQFLHCIFAVCFQDDSTIGRTRFSHPDPMTSASPDSGGDLRSVVVVTPSFWINAHIIVVGSCEQESGRDAVENCSCDDESDEQDGSSGQTITFHH